MSKTHPNSEISRALSALFDDIHPSPQPPRASLSELIDALKPPPQPPKASLSELIDALKPPPQPPKASLSELIDALKPPPQPPRASLSELIDALKSLPQNSERGSGYDEVTLNRLFAQAPYHYSGSGYAEIRWDRYGNRIRRDEYGLRTDYGWEVDHIIPKSSGGGDELRNLQPLHWWTNRSKGSRLI